ncbi:hypothetical protein C2G38_2145649 [Gigaspora rosea]|uniref:SWIM-type domain-containing protein n=1 Tax=Gigaspora rosea TaxID=44941 RepID=A0A397UM39_9GLOM|nr:hypothetical protein C2G38_2145649 [Gigaspora rosea]
MLENHQPKIDRITRMNLVHVVLIVTRRLTYTGLKIIKPEYQTTKHMRYYVPKVDSILNNFVAPNLIEKIRYEINHSLFYHATIINPECLHLFQTQDDDMVFINNAFDYPLAHSFTLFKQVESNVAEIWEVRHMTWQHSQLHVFLLKDGSFICSCMLLVNRGYPCRHFFRVMAYSIAAKFSINFVAKRWLLEKYQDEDLGIQPLVNLSAVFSSESSETLLVPTTIIRSNESANLFSVSCTASNVAYSSSYTAAKNAMQKKKAYAETIGIARKAINIAIEKDDLQVLKFLKGYILQNDHSLVENTTIVCSSSSRTSILEERSEPNTILEKPQVKVTNPIKKAITVDGMPNMRIRACDSTMTCEFCGGGGHNKELHKLDHSINDENEWVDSNSSSSESEEIEMDTE